MKIRLPKDPTALAFAAQIDKLRHRPLDPVTNVQPRLESTDALRQRIDLVELISRCLKHDPVWIGDEARFHCEWHKPDTNPSLWCNPNHRSGYPRWGCNPCGLMGD